MRELTLLLAVCATLVSWMPINAQSSLANEERLVSLPTEEELSLQCAIWALHLADIYRDKAEEHAFNQAFSYFAGRYEGLSRQGIDQAVDEVFLAEATKRTEFVMPVCAAMIRGHDERLVNWLTVLEAASVKAVADKSAFDPAHPKIVPIEPNPAP